MSSTQDSTAARGFARYDGSLEVRKPDEEQVFDEIASTMRGISQIFNDRARNAYRSVHAKSHGLLKGELRVYDGLPEPYRQGLFARTETLGVILRFSTNPGDILPDSISTPRGLAVKVIGIEGAAMVAEHAGQTTQDFVMVNGREFGAPDAAGFLKQLRLLAKHAGDSQTLKQFVSTTARAVESTVEVLGGESALLKQFGHPETNILGESYFAQLPLRYGQFVGKISVTPLSENLKKLTGQAVEIGDRYSALRDEVVRFFQTETAEWEVKVQLCTDITRMPVEDASVPWPENESPFVPVARITVPAQEAYSPARRVYFDELLSFNPWHAMADHQPLGNVMRARRKAYAMSSQYRHSMNGRELAEPRSMSEIPD
jgi:catalase